MSWLTREIIQRKHSTPAWLLQSARPLSPVTFPGSWSGKFSETASCAYYLFTKTTGKEAEHQTEAGDPLVCSTFPNVSFHQDTATGASFPWVPLSFSFFLILKNLQNIFSDMNMERGTNYPKPNFFFYGRTQSVSWDVFWVHILRRAVFAFCNGTEEKINWEFTA